MIDLDEKIGTLVEKSNREWEEVKFLLIAGRSGCFAKLLAFRDGDASRP